MHFSRTVYYTGGTVRWYRKGPSRWYRNGLSRWYSRPIFSNFFSEKGCIDGTTRFSKNFFMYIWVFRCTGSWGISALGEGQLGEGPVCGSVTWRKCQFEDFNLSDSLSTVFILIHFYLMNATNENYFLNKICSINYRGRILIFI